MIYLYHEISCVLSSSGWCVWNIQWNFVQFPMGIDFEGWNDMPFQTARDYVALEMIHYSITVEFRHSRRKEMRIRCFRPLDSEQVIWVDKRPESDKRATITDRHVITRANRHDIRSGRTLVSFLRHFCLVLHWLTDSKPFVDVLRIFHNLTIEYRV
jgi:hypothetical protein